ncbi:MoaD/ThiS family protein [Castellaniella sp. GW247-6E4]|uniref:MoaD/ThiS family protein n=1 Tax=Castellaniella sp. GW247-6E4 TaxID=3140380 RepID=UPI0033147D72
MNGATIEVLYFAQVAEHMGTRRETLALAGPMPAARWLEDLVARCPDLAPVDRLKLAINQEHVDHLAMIHPGDEVAVFEPVTGG